MSDQKNKAMQQEPTAIVIGREEFINMLKGIGVPYGGIEGLSVYTGNQWVESWQWDMKALDDLTDAMLWMMYCKIKKDREKAKIEESNIILVQPIVQVVKS